MARHSRWRRLSVAVCVLVAAMMATDAPAAPAEAPQDNGAPAQPLRPDPAFAHLPRYEGRLGERPIVVHLGPKDDEPGVHGEYQFVDTGVVVLLAGDRDGDTLEIEESDDGTNITGVWVGRFDASGALKADRMNADESDPQPVVLRPASSSALQVREDGVHPLRAASCIIDLRSPD